MTSFVDDATWPQKCLECDGRWLAERESTMCPYCGYNPHD